MNRRAGFRLVGALRQTLLWGPFPPSSPFPPLPLYAGAPGVLPPEKF